VACDLSMNFLKKAINRFVIIVNVHLTNFLKSFWFYVGLGSRAAVSVLVNSFALRLTDFIRL